MTVWVQSVQNLGPPRHLISAKVNPKLSIFISRDYSQVITSHCSSLWSQEGNWKRSMWPTIIDHNSTQWTIVTTFHTIGFRFKTISMLYLVSRMLLDAISSMHYQCPKTMHECFIPWASPFKLTNKQPDLLDKKLSTDEKPAL